MDFNLAALKLLSCELKSVKQKKNQNAQSLSLSLFGIHFQRAWLQGVLISIAEERLEQSEPLEQLEQLEQSDQEQCGGRGRGRGRFLLDDGTDVVELTIPPSLSPSIWKPGMYVMVVGPYTPPTAGSPSALPSIQVHKMVDLSSQPHREALWYLEVVEAHRLFYVK